MAVVPRIDSVELDTNTGRQRVSAQDEAFGALEARGMASLAQGLGVVARVAQEKQNEFDVVDAQNMDNALAARVRERLYNTKDGYLSTARGVNAELHRGAIETGLTTDLEEVARTARNPRAAALFRDAGGRRIQGALGQVSTHLANETRAAQVESLQAGLTETINGAAASWSDAGARDAQLRTADGIIDTVGRLEGWTPDVIEANRREARSNVYRAVVGEMAVSSPETVGDFMLSIDDELDVQTRGELRTLVRTAQAQARELVMGSIWQAVANGQDPRNTAEWAQFSTNPLYGREHEQLNEYLRQRAESRANSALSNRQSELSGDTLEAIGAIDPRAFMLMTDYAMGRIDVGPRRTRQAAPDMTPEEFQAQTGYTPQQARTMFRAMNPDDVLRVVNRRSGQTDNAAIDQAFDDIRAVAEPLAQSMGLAVTGTAERTAEQRGAFQAYLLREARAYVLQHGQRPDDEAVQIIARRALLRSRGGFGGNSGYAFEASPERRVEIRYDDIPDEDQRALVAAWRRQNPGRSANAEALKRWVEQAYANQLQAAE